MLYVVPAQALLPDAVEPERPENPFKGAAGTASQDAQGDRRQIDGPKIPLQELFSLVRHSKLALIKEALDYLPSKKFDKSLVQVL